MGQASKLGGVGIWEGEEVRYWELGMIQLYFNKNVKSWAQSLINYAQKIGYKRLPSLIGCGQLIVDMVGMCFLSNDFIDIRVNKIPLIIEVTESHDEDKVVGEELLWNKKA